MATTKPSLYRDVIDDLVEVCKDGQGQIGARWVRSGEWLSHLDAESSPREYATRQFVARLSASDREILARMVADSFSDGVFNTLVTLDEHQIAPFEDGYEGSACNDFIGRMAGDWDWPESA